MKASTLATGWFIGVSTLGWLGRAEAQVSANELFFRHVVGDVTGCSVTPDGERVVFRADLEYDEQFELFSAPTDGSAAPVQLNEPLPLGGDVSVKFTLSPDGEFVAYLADGDTDTVDELFCAPVDGSTAAVRVSAQAHLDFVISFRFTPDSTRLVFEGRTSDGRDEIWCAPLDGSSALEVSGSMAPGGNPLDSYSVSSDSTRLVYVADAVTDGVVELFSAPLDGSGPAVKLNPTPVLNGNVVSNAFAITPDSTRVVYLADQAQNNVFALYSAPIDGSATAVRISRPTTLFADVENGFVFTPSGDVVYRADHDEDNARELYVVPADGSAAALKLNAPLDSGESCEDFVVAASSHVVYRSDQDTDDVIELYAVPLDASQTTVKLSGTLTTGGDVEVDYQVSSDGTRVVYRADQDTDTIIELYGAPRNGSSAAVKLNPTLPPNRSVQRGTPIDPDGTRVVFAADLTGDNKNELLVAPIDGSSAAQVLNDQGMVVGLVVSGSFGFAAGDSVLYRGVLDPLDVDFVEELFMVPLDASAAPLVLHSTPALGDLDGDILSYRLTNDGLGVAYVAREKQGDRGLYAAPLSAPASPLRIAGAPVLQPNFVIGPDDQRAAFLSAFDGSQELYSVPLDGSALAVKLSGTMVPSADVENDFAFTPDAAQIVFRADAAEFGRFELFSVEADGGTPPTQLSAALVANGDVTGFRISPDGTRVVYLADQDVDTRPELYSVPIDGSAAPVKLNGALPLSTSVRDDFRIHPDGSRVFYRADEDLLSAVELFSVPIDGSAAATTLNGPLASGGSVFDYQLDASGDLVVYRAEQDVNFAIELYAVPSDGSAAPVKLNPPLANQGNVGEYALAADGSRVAFSGQVALTGVSEVWSVPADLSAPAIRLHPALSGQADAGLEALTPDGTTALYILTNGLGSPHDLYTVPIDGSASPVLLHEPAVQGELISELVVSPDSSRVVYRADHDQNDVIEVYSAPTDGSSTEEKISGSLAQGGDVLAPLRFTADSSSVLFIADHAADEVYELFAASIVGGQLPARLHPPLVDPRTFRRANGVRRSVGF